MFDALNQDTKEDLLQWYRTLNVGLKKVHKSLCAGKTTHAQQYVEELLDDFNDIEYFIQSFITSMPTNQFEIHIPNFISRVDLYYHLFMSALRNTTKRSDFLDSTIKEDPAKYVLNFENHPKGKPTNFMVFLIEKVLGEKIIMDEVLPILVHCQKATRSSKELIAKCIYEYFKFSYGEVMVDMKNIQEKLVQDEYTTTNRIEQEEKKKKIQKDLEKMVIKLVDQFKVIEVLILKMSESQLQAWKQEQNGAIVMSQIDLYHQLFMYVLRRHHSLTDVSDFMIIENPLQYIPTDGSIDFMDFLCKKVLGDEEAIMEEIWPLMNNVNEKKALIPWRLEFITKCIIVFVKKSIIKLKVDLSENIYNSLQTDKTSQRAVAQVEDLLKLFNTIEGSINKIPIYQMDAQVQDAISYISSRPEVYYNLIICALREKDAHYVPNDMDNPFFHYTQELTEFMVFLVMKVVGETTMMRESIWPLLATSDFVFHAERTKVSIRLITKSIIFFIQKSPKKFQTLRDNVLKSLQDGAMEGAMRRAEELLDFFNAIEILIANPNANYQLSTYHLRNFDNVIKDMINNTRSANDLSKILLELWASFIHEQTRSNIQVYHDTNSSTFRKIEVYYQLFVHALKSKLSKFNSIKISEVSKNLDEKIAKELLKDNYEVQPTDFMVSLVKKLLREEAIMNEIWPCMTIMWPSIAQDDKHEKRTWKFEQVKRDLRYLIITKCIHMYERKLFDHLISQIEKLSDPRPSDFEKCANLLQDIMKHVKKGDINNRGRVYNYVLSRFEDEGKLHEFFVDLFFKDEEIMQNKHQLTFGWIRKYDFKHLSMCVWECHQKSGFHPSKLCTEVGDAKFALNAGALIGQRLHNTGNFFDIWPEFKLDVNTTYRGVTALHAAAYIGHIHVINHLLIQRDLDINARTSHNSRGKSNKWKLHEAQTVLHIAVDQEHWEIVKLLCDNRQNELHIKNMRFHEEDGDGKTAIDMIYKKIRRMEKLIRDDDKTLDKNPQYVVLIDIKKMLLKMDDVQKGIERLYRDRQVHLDAANAILVGAALIAGVAFAGWLQPPLGYSDYYQLELPPPAPPNTYESYAAYNRYKSIQAFALFNSLSFFFAIATVISGADAAFPMGDRYIGDVVKSMQHILRRAIKFLIISMLCVLGAFTSAGIAILPPHLYFRKHFVLSIIVGSGLCCVMIWQLMTRHSKRVQRLNKYVIRIINSYINRC